MQVAPGKTVSSWCVQEYCMWLMGKSDSHSGMAAESHTNDCFYYYLSVKIKVIPLLHEKDGIVMPLYKLEK